MKTSICLECAHKGEVERRTNPYFLNQPKKVRGSYRIHATRDNDGQVHLMRSYARPMAYAECGASWPTENFLVSDFWTDKFETVADAMAINEANSKVVSK